MNKIDLSIRLRPIRFAYLTNPSDTNSLLRIFESNTCLWGGMFNPIIPFYKKTPKWWKNHPAEHENFKEIIKGYLNYFEPDFIVETKPGITKYLGIPKESVISMNDLIVNKSFDEESWDTYGTNMFDVYKSLYQKEFKFQRRHAEKFVSINSKFKKNKLSSSCLFGSFSQNPNFIYLKSAYKEVFNPEEINYDGSTLSDIYKSRKIFPLIITSTKCNTFFAVRNEPTLYIFDSTKSHDLIDFWNLRIIYPDIYAIPIQFLEELKDFCKNFIIQNNIPLPGNNSGVMVHTTIQSSRSISFQKIKDIVNEFFTVEKKDAVVIRSWYPPIWKEPPEMIWQPTRSVINCGEKKIEITTENNYAGITFETLSPDFPESIRNHYRWANVLEFSDWSFRDEVATVFPDNLMNPFFSRLYYNHKLRINTEGLIIYPRHKNSKEYWTLVNGTIAISEFLKHKGIKAEISDAGKTLKQIVQTVGGLLNVGSIADSKLIDLFNKMAHKQVKIEDDKHEIIKEYLGRTVQYSTINKTLNEITHNQFLSPISLESLINNKIIQLGLEIECEHCGSRNWYLINNLDYKLSCENCLSSFDFPNANPTNRKINWSYRLIGPFSKPDYANGGYSSVLALRFFRHSINSLSDTKFSWSTSLNLESKNGQKWELDFLIWYQRKRIIENNYNVDFIFGESKSFGKQSFEKKNILSLKRMAIYFPGLILVFATLKEELSKEEKELIIPLANWGRVSLPLINGKTRAPVIILTAIELFAINDLRDTYQKKGGLFAKLISPGYIRLENLRVLANITQQLHLGMKSYYELLENKFKKS